MFHAYDESGQSTWADKETKHSPEIWCRAMGWFGMTLMEVLELLPKDHPARPKLIAQRQPTREGMEQNYQNKRKQVFGTRLSTKDKTLRDWLETSSSSMYTYVIARAVERGFVDKIVLRKLPESGMPVC